MKSKNYKVHEEILTLSRKDPIVHQLFAAYNRGSFLSYEEFLVALVQTLVAVKEGLHDRFEELYTKGLPPMYITAEDKLLEQFHKSVEDFKEDVDETMKVPVHLTKEKQ